MRTSLLTAAILLLPCLSPIAVHTPAPTSAQTRDSLEVLRVAERFHAALVGGDSAGAMKLLAPDATILESGDLETRSEYQAHHLGADMEFSAAVKGEHSSRTITIEGTTAWVSSTSIARGQFRNRQINSQTAELMVLSQTGGGWSIRAIHWSSHNIR